MASLTGSGRYGRKQGPGGASGAVWQNAKSIFRVVFTEQTKDIWNRGKNDIVCARKGHGAPSLLAPKYDAGGIFDSGIAEAARNGKHDKFGSGAYSAGGEEFLLLGRDPFCCDFPPNVFLTMCAIREGRVVETGELQVNMLGEIVLVNRFEGVLPCGIELDEWDIREISEQRSWDIERRSGVLTIKVPSSKYRKIYDSSLMVPGERNRIRVKMDRDLSVPVVLTGEDEAHIAGERAQLERQFAVALSMRR